MTKLQEVIKTASKSIEKLQTNRTKKIDPLIDDRTLKLRLYGLDNIFFDSVEKLESYRLQNQIATDDFYVLDYMNTLAGRKDVIRQIDTTGRIALYTVIDENGYGKYNSIKSQEAKRPIWEYHEGSIEWMYQPFKDHGIKLTEDIYENTEKKYQYIRNRIKNHNTTNKQ